MNEVVKVRKKFICIVIALILIVLCGCSTNPIQFHIDKIIELHNHRNAMAQQVIDNYTDDDYVKLYKSYMERDTIDMYVQFYALYSNSNDEITKFVSRLNQENLEIFTSCKNEYDIAGLQTLNEHFQPKD